MILGLAGLAVEFAVLSMYIATAARIRTRGITPTSRIWAERVGGVFMIGVAGAVVRE
jgi:threonine/homoserine/homoserine lactone efflux protein